MKYLILIFFTVSVSHAFTLNNNFGASFKKNKVKVAVAEDSICTGVTAQEIESLIGPAVNDFWNEVPTSRLRLKPSGFAPRILTADINTARLCSPTDSVCIADANTKAQPLLPPVEGIIISCSSTADNFSSPSVIAVTVPNSFTGKKIRGAVILINDAGNFKNLSHSDRIGVLAHEIGHAIGLGHAENSEPEALMYYKTVDLRRSLGEDDIRGVTYLYPVKVDACGLMDSLVASTVVVKKNDDDDEGSGGTPFWQMGIGLFFFVILTELLRLLKRPQARPTF